MNLGLGIACLAQFVSHARGHHLKVEIINVKLFFFDFYQSFYFPLQNHEILSIPWLQHFVVSIYINAY